MSSIITVPSDNSILEVKVAGSWTKVPGASGWTESGGAAPERDIVAFEGVSSRSGRVRPPSIEIAVTAYLPYHASWQAIRAAALAKTPMEFRITTPEEVLFEEKRTSGGPQLAISNGALTVSSADDFPDLTELQYADGIVLQITPGRKANGYVLTALAKSSATATAFKSADATVNEAAAPYRILIPSLRRGPFTALILNADLVTLQSEGEMASSLTLKPFNFLPAWEIQLSTT